MLTVIDDRDKNLLKKRSEVNSLHHHQNKFELVNLMSCKSSNDVI